MDINFGVHNLMHEGKENFLDQSHIDGYDFVKFSPCCFIILLGDVIFCFWQFVDYGIEGSVLLFETCLDYLSRAELKNPQLEAVVASLFKYIFDRPNFCTIFCQSLRSTAISETFLENLSNTLHFSASEKIGMGLALVGSEHPEFRTCGEFNGCWLFFLYYFPFITSFLYL